MKKRCAGIIVLLGCCLFVTAYAKDESKNEQADYIVSEQEDVSDTFETDHEFYTNADDTEYTETELQNEQTDYLLSEAGDISETAETDHQFYTSEQ